MHVEGPLTTSSLSVTSLERSPTKMENSFSHCGAAPGMPVAQLTVDKRKQEEYQD